jgi:hypothetical protein
MNRSVAAWEDDGGARRPRFGSSVVQRRNPDQASTPSQSGKSKRRRSDGKIGKLRKGIVPVIAASE